MKMCNNFEIISDKRKRVRSRACTYTTYDDGRIIIGERERANLVVRSSGIFYIYITRSNAMHYWRAGATQQSRSAMMV